MFWIARLFTGLLLAAGGCSAVVGVITLSNGIAGKGWMGVAFLVAGAGGVVAAFTLDGMVVRAIRRWNSVPQARGFDVVLREDRHSRQGVPSNETCGGFPPRLRPVARAGSALVRPSRIFRMLWSKATF
jgi:hypothetical protein